VRPLILDSGAMSDAKAVKTVQNAKEDDGEESVLVEIAHGVNEIDFFQSKPIMSVLLVDYSTETPKPNFKLYKTSYLGAPQIESATSDLSTIRSSFLMASKNTYDKLFILSPVKCTLKFRCIRRTFGLY